jgi:hypothetical protein
MRLNIRIINARLCASLEFIMRGLKYWLLCPVLSLAAFAAQACYTVYDQSDRVVSQSEKAPVDMSRPLHETLPPGSHMIFDGSECAVIGSLAVGRGGRNVSSASPLLTDERTARALKLPHTTAPGGIAIVQARDAVMAPGIMVVPSEGGTVTAKRAVRDTVITEWRNPPSVTVESTGRAQPGDATRMMGAGPSSR